MLMAHNFRLSDLNYKDVKGRYDSVAIIPVSAIEAHGPHLPLGVDALLNDSLLDRVIELNPSNNKILVLPNTNFGMSIEHSAYPGTISIKAETLIEYWIQIAVSLKKSGFRKVLFFNSHGGQVGIADIVLRKLRAEHNLLAHSLHWFKVQPPEGLFEDEELKYGIHGGEVETSLMLHKWPSLVKMEFAQNFDSFGKDLAKKYKFVNPTGSALSFGWQTQDLNAEGAVGNAAAANAEKGMQFFEFIAKEVSSMISEIIELSPEVLKSPVDLV